MRSPMPWLWPSLTNKSLIVATHVDLRVSNVLSQRDLRAFKVLVWEVDALPVVCEDIVAAWVALESMMLPSDAELPKSLTDHGNYESCWVQTVAIEWWEDVHHSYPRPWNWHVYSIDVSRTCVPHERKNSMKALPILSEWSGSHAREHLPGCCANLEGELAWAWCPSSCKTWDESLGGSVWTTWSHLTWWCMTQPWRCRTSGTQTETKLRQEPCYSLEHCLHL